MESFTECLIAKHGSIARAWRDGLDKKKSGQISKEQFVEAMKAMEFQASAEKVFEYLDADHSGFISLDEIDEEAVEIIKSGDLELGLDIKVTVDMTSMTFDERQAFANRRNQAIGKQQKKNVEEEERRKKAADARATNLVDLKKQLKVIYGNLYRAWKVALDLDGSGKLSENEFMKALRDLGLFFGSLPDLWKELQEDGFISFDRFSPDDAKELNAFRECLLAKYPSIARAWRFGLDKTKTNRLGKEEFVAAMGELGFAGNAARVYALLDNDNSGYITVEEVDADAHEMLVRDPDLELGLDVPLDPASLEGLSWAEKQALGTTAARQRAAEGNLQRKKIDAEAEAEAKRRAGATSLPQFKQHMMLKFESMVTAWYALDKTGKGQMGSMDFAEAARAHGYEGDMKALFGGIDKSGDGIVTLDEWAPEVKASETFEAFGRILQEFPSMKLAFLAFDPEKTGRADKAGILKVCEPKGFKDVEKLFELMNVPKVKGYITEMDVVKNSFLKSFAQRRESKGEEELHESNAAAT